ncbi:MAG: hypothetical protein JSV19_07820 [Phycisphaerales bacterium]|nr:MAG: hypothetical protein JSV19_07820 [Phycisphaerales bacterium]
MKRKWVALTAIGCCVLGSLTLVGWAMDTEEKEDAGKVTIEQLPAKAKDAVQRLVGTNTIKELEKETEHGTVVYGVEWTANGKEWEAEFTADGELLEVEEAVSADEVPAAVRDAAAKALGKAAKVEFERVTITLYEAEATVDGKEREILISPTGKLVHHKEGTEHKEHEHEHEEDDD